MNKQDQDLNMKIMAIRESWGEISEYCQDEIMDAVFEQQINACNMKKKIQIMFKRHMKYVHGMFDMACPECKLFERILNL